MPERQERLIGPGVTEGERRWSRTGTGSTRAQTWLDTGADITELV